MSGYTFRIWFSGLVHFVENRDPNAKCQLCVVLPVADDDRKHVGAIYTAEREIRCGKLRLKQGRRLLDLPRRRVAFRITRVDDIPPNSRSSLVVPFGFLHMNEIAGVFADENDQIVRAVPPPPPTVLAQILIEGGYDFGFDALSILREWTLPSTLTGDLRRILVADPVFVDIPNVEKVEMLYYSLDDPAEPASSGGELQPGGERRIEIFVSNRCEERCHYKPEDIEVRFGDNSVSIIQIDSDFKYNYNMLHPITLDAIKRVVPKKEENNPDSEPRLPLPESPLIEISLAPHLCSPCFSGHTDEAEWKEEEEYEEVAGQRGRSNHGERHVELRRVYRRFILRPLREVTMALQKFGAIDLLVVILNKLFPTGIGTGSGSDCLGSKGEARFVSLDRYIPAPVPPVSLVSVHALSRARIRPFPDRLPFSGPFNPVQPPQLPVEKQTQGLTGGPTPPQNS